MSCGRGLNIEYKISSTSFNIKRYPRDVTQFLQRIERYWGLSEPVARFQKESRGDSLNMQK